MKILIIFGILILIPISVSFADEFKATYNYNLDDVAFQICKDKFDIYENAASMHMGDPHQLMQWKQYTQCHDDAFVVLHETKHLCLDEVIQLKKVMAIGASLDYYDRLHYDSKLVNVAEKAIDCHVRVYHEEMTKFQTIQTTEPKIICGSGTIEIDSICQVDQSKLQSVKKSKGFFSWFFDWFR